MRYWGQDSFHFYSPTHAIWPARAGRDGIDPSSNNYPANLDSWLVCGPFDFTNGQTLLTRYNRWVDIANPNDFFKWGYSTDGNYFTILAQTTGQENYWEQFSLFFESLAGKPQVWVALVFASDSTPGTSKGVWVDDLEIWRYNKPAPCETLDPGNKGLVLPAYELSSGAWYPFIRAGESNALTGTIQAKAQWVRLPFIIPRSPDTGAPVSSAVDNQHYDRMVDSLCAAGIGVLGLINHETLTRPLSEADIDASAASYRQEFVGEATWLAYHFKSRIKYWEVWNEPVVTAPLNASHYAALLTQTANSIKSANPDAKVLFAGLEHAWNDYDNYFAQVYARLDNEQGHARPFDVFAVHPYPNKIEYGPDPQIYMHGKDDIRPDLGDRTIVDKFVRRMEGNGDTGKKVWATEVGWSSALGQPNAEPMAVDRLTQAFYLQKGFDILFNEARSVDRVFWWADEKRFN